MLLKNFVVTNNDITLERAIAKNNFSIVYRLMVLYQNILDILQPMVFTDKFSGLLLKLLPNVFNISL